MEEENIFFDYQKQPGKVLNKIEMPQGSKPKISIITSYYNSDEYLWQTFCTVENQTFPYWEWIIVDDGSAKEKTDILDKIASQDSRIYIYHKENEGLAKGRDFAISKATTNYIFPLDADDLIDKTMLECSFWALETFPKATWCYSNIVGFQNMIYLDAREFDVEKMKVDNQITATALIRRKAIEELGGYQKAKRYINEDWHLWLRMLQKGYFPIHMRFYGFWYRRKEKNSLLKQINDPHSEANLLRLEAIKDEAMKVKQKVEAIELPTKLAKETEIIDMNYADFPEVYFGNNVLIIAPWLRTDKHVLEIVEKEKDKHITIITTKPCNYIGRQWYEDKAEVFDLTTFLAQKNHEDFIKYIIKTRNVKKVYFCNTDKIQLDSNIEVICDSYIEDESMYAVYEKKYKKSKTLWGKILRKLRIKI